MSENIDPKHEMLHRVLLIDIERYKAGITPKVAANCGKIWRPTFPVNKTGSIPRCPVCFPIEQLRFGVAK